MWTDVAELARFYAQPMGHTACRLVDARLEALPAPRPGERVLGLGYAPPYLERLRAGAERVVVAMPAGQGVLRWPDRGPALSMLVEETALPLGDATFDRVVLVHCIETAESGGALLREAWRVLVPGGRLVAVVPNRSGLWARTERTPFGQGRPYSRGQLGRRLREALFEPVVWDQALLAPPLALALAPGWAPVWERVGGALWPAFAGVIIVEAEKRLYAPVARKRLPAIDPKVVLAPTVKAPRAHLRASNPG